KGAVLAVRDFVQTMYQGITGGLAGDADAVVKQFFAAVLDEVARELQADHSLRLAQILLDVNDDHVVSSEEDHQVIDRLFLLNRWLGQAGVVGLVTAEAVAAIVTGGAGAGAVETAANATEALFDALLRVGTRLVQEGRFTLDTLVNDPFYH